MGTQNRPLIVALGGGGDVITATARARDCGGIAASLVWEKLAVDPEPGPRGPAELAGMTSIGTLAGLASPKTRFRHGALTTQAIMAGVFEEVPQVVLDSSLGVRGLVQALRDTCDHFGVTEVQGIDVGGDVLSTGPLPTVTSPLIDALLTTAVWKIESRARVTVFGLGLDGEIPEERLWNAVENDLASGFVVGLNTLSLASMREVVKLLDQRLIGSEVSSLLARAHLGMSGRVLLRDGGLRTTVSPASMIGFVYSADHLVRNVNPACLAVQDCEDLEAASKCLLLSGYRTELEDQIRITSKPSFLIENPHQIDQKLSEVLCDLRGKEDGIDFVAIRYLAKQIGCSSKHAYEAVVRSMDSLGLLIQYPYVGIAG
jgi:hypothetical protein